MCYSSSNPFPFFVVKWYAMADKVGLVTFFKQVRAEAAKVVWPTRRETIISTIFVFVMLLLISLFLFGAGHLIQYCLWAVINFLEHLFY